MTGTTALTDGVTLLRRACVFAAAACCFVGCESLEVLMPEPPRRDPSIAPLQMPAGWDAPAKPVVIPARTVKPEPTPCPAPVVRAPAPPRTRPPEYKRLVGVRASPATPESSLKPTAVEVASPAQSEVAVVPEARLSAPVNVPPPAPPPMPEKLIGSIPEPEAIPSPGDNPALPPPVEEEPAPSPMPVATIARELDLPPAPVTNAALIPLGAAAPALPAHGWIGCDPVTPDEQAGKVVLLTFFYPKLVGEALPDELRPDDTLLLQLMQVQMRFGDRFLAVGIADAEPKRLRTFHVESGGAFRLLQDTGQAIRRQYFGSLQALPAYALLDAEGRLAWLGQGIDATAVIDEIERQLQPAASPACPQDSLRPQALVIGGAHARGSKSFSLAASASAERLAASLAVAWDLTAVNLMLADAPKTGPLSADRVLQALVHAIESWQSHAPILVYFAVDLQVRGDALDLMIPASQGNQALPLARVAGVLSRARRPALMVLDGVAVNDRAAVLRWEEEARHSSCLSVPTLLAWDEDHPNESRHRSGKALQSRVSRVLASAVLGAADCGGDNAVDVPEIVRELRLRLLDQRRKAGMPFHLLFCPAEGAPIANYPVSSLNSQ